MLGKLMKLELRSTFRQYAALYAAALLLTGLVVGGVLLKSELIAFLALIFYSIMSIVMLTVTVVFIIQRYAKNLFGVEGHFMHTLPTTPGKLLASKTLVSLLWLIVPYFMIFGSYGLLFWAGKTLLGDFMVHFNEGFRSVIDVNFPLLESFSVYLPYWVASMLLAITVSIMMFFFSVTAANTLARRRRVLTGVLIFLGLNGVYSGLCVGIYTFSPLTFRAYGHSIVFDGAPMGLLQPITEKGLPISPLVDLLAVVFFVVLTAATLRLLKNRLSQRG